jgi:hypothetical protein
MQLIVEGQAVRQLPGPKAEHVGLFARDQPVDLTDDGARVCPDGNARVIQIAPEDAVRAGKRASLYKIYRFIPAANMLSGSRAVPDNTAFRVYAAYRG